MTTGARGYDIAIVGMACRVPGARTLDAFWENLREGVESIVPLSAEQLRAAGVTDAEAARPDYVKRAALLEGMADFDGAFFGFSPREASILDPQHRHFLECAWEAIEHAGLRPDRMPGPVGVFAGSGHNAYLPLNLLTHPDLVESVGLFLLRHTGNDKDFLTTRVSHLFDLRGPSIGVQTACSTSLVALHLGCQSLLAGECDVALAGGVTIELPHGQGYRYQEGEILSPDGHCRPFDADARGTVFGSGAAVVVLRRLSDALADGDRVWAVVRGSAVNNDGSLKAGYLAPSVDGQAQVIAEALAVAGVTPASIGFIEAHGTGTPIGDPIEVAALSQVFGAAESGEQCVLGSVKSNIGHLDTAAGAVGLIKTVLAMAHREIPPTLHFSRANPACELDRSPFRVNARLRPWGGGSTPRRAGVTSLGVGGTNAHVVLEEAPRTMPSSAPAVAQVLMLSARSSAALGRARARLASHLAGSAQPDLGDVAFTLARGRVPMPYRTAIVAGALAEAATQLARPLDRVSHAAADRRPEVAFLLPGGGTQYPGMGAELLALEPVYRDAVEESLAPLPRQDRERILELLATPAADPRSAQAMERPSLGLPALFATQVALSRLWMSWGVEPAVLIGHSMGEYTAAWLAGVFSLPDAMRLVRFRGDLFDRLPAGAMLSVAMDAPALARELDPELSIAAVNAPGLCVASGPVTAITRLEDRLVRANVEHSRLRIATAAHSAMLDGVLEEFRSFLEGLPRSAPGKPIASNLTGTWLTESEAVSADYWVRHLRQTVRFADGLGAVLQSPDRVLLEVGPGRTLSALSRANPACGARRVLTSLPAAQEPAEPRRHLLGAAAALWERGIPLDTADLFGPGRRRKTTLPTYPFERVRHWIAPAAGPPAARRAAPTAGSAPARLFRVVWERAEAASAPRHTNAWLVHNGSGFAQVVADALTSAGSSVQLIPGKIEGLPEGSLSAPDVVLDLRQPPDGDPMAQARWAADTGLPGLLSLARILAEKFPETRVELAAITTDLEQVAGDGIGPAAQAVTAAAVHSLAAEIPGLVARHIDVGRAAPGSAEESLLATRLVAELGRPDSRVALRGADRWIPAYAGAEEENHAIPPPKPGDVFIITGGLGAIGQALAADLARVPGVRLALITRHELPPRESWSDLASGADATAGKVSALLELERAGAEVTVLVGDVSRSTDVARCVAAVRARWGRVTGVVHAAGLLRDRLVWDKTPEEIRRVIEPKVLGAIALDLALADDPPAWMVFLSSTSAFAGLPGQTDYAAANAALDAIAVRRTRERPGRTVAMAWSAWRDTGMTSVKSPYAGARREISLDPANDWMLSEHRLSSGEAILPGTGFLDLAASTAGIGSEGVELHEVTIRSPVLVPDGGSRRLLCEIDRDGRIAIKEAGGLGEEFFSARVAGLPPGPVPRPDLTTLWTTLGSPAQEASTAEASGQIHFGPRWKLVCETRSGPAEAVLRLALAETYAADLAEHPAHPALLDVATAGAQHLIPGWPESHSLFVPVSYGRVRLFRPLPREVVSHVRYRGDAESDGALAQFDVVIVDPEGTVVAEIAPLVMMRVEDPDQLRHRDLAPRVTSARQAAPPAVVGGWSREEGVALFWRALASTASAHVLITPGDPEAYLSGLRSPGAPAAGSPPQDLARLELALTMLPEIQDSAIRARREGDGAGITAFVVLRPGARATVSELRRALRESLPEGPLPQAIVELDRLPRREDGTLDWAQVHDPLGGADRTAGAPTTPMQRLLADTWRQLLGVEAVGLRDNFFDVGGHSLLSIRLISKLHQATRVRLRHEDIVVNTLEQLAAKLEAGAQTAA